jgi:Ca2+-binding EF-hand superfamily protein
MTMPQPPRPGKFGSRLNGGGAASTRAGAGRSGGHGRNQPPSTETTMFKPLICTALVLASGFALAQPGDADREARRAEWQAKAEARFAEADTDRDGRLDRVEAQAFGERFNQHFDRIDANHDGEVDKQEIAQARQHARKGRHGMRQHAAFQRGLFKGMDDNGDGAISRAELGDKMPRWSENFAGIDTNGDGQLSREELRAAKRAAHEQRKAAREG